MKQKRPEEGAGKQQFPVISLGYKFLHFSLSSPHPLQALWTSQDLRSVAKTLKRLQWDLVFKII
jgi:hypothetical protein